MRLTNGERLARRRRPPDRVARTRWTRHPWTHATAVLSIHRPRDFDRRRTPGAHPGHHSDGAHRRTAGGRTRLDVDRHHRCDRPRAVRRGVRSFVANAIRNAPPGSTRNRTRDAAGGVHCARPLTTGGALCPCALREHISNVARCDSALQ